MTTATWETQAQIWMILVTVSLYFAAWKLTLYRILLCSSLGQGVESLGVKVNISAF